MKKHYALIAPLVLLAISAAPALAQDTTPRTATHDRTTATTSAPPAGGHTTKEASTRKPADEVTIGEGPNTATVVIPPNNNTKGGSTQPGAARPGPTQGAGPGPTPTQPSTTPSVFTSPSTVEPFGEAQLRKDLEDVKNSYVSKEDLGPLSWLTNRLIFWLVVVFTYSLLVLNAAQLFRKSHADRTIGEIYATLRQMKATNLDSRPDNTPPTGNLTG